MGTRERGSVFFLLGVWSSPAQRGTDCNTYPYPNSVFCDRKDSGSYGRTRTDPSVSRIRIFLRSSHPTF